MEANMMSENPNFSIIIPVEKKTSYIMEALKHWNKQTYRSFEVIVSSTKRFNVPYSFAKVIVEKNLTGDVSSKRNKIQKYGKGSIFIFQDDDVFVPNHYLSEAAKMFKDKTVIAAGGPHITPKKDLFMQQAGGAVWESTLGTFGAGTYRNRVENERIVYDFPSSNLIIRKSVFNSLGGFEPGLYPGEDTKLCLLMLGKYNKGVLYSPKLFVYHHRKPLFKKHLQQVGRFGYQRGHFALAYPGTSFKLAYFLPSILLFYFLGITVILWHSVPVYHNNIYTILLLPLFMYVLIIFIESIAVCIQRGWKIGALVFPGILLTHLYYGFRFSHGMLVKLISRIQKIVS